MELSKKQSSPSPLASPTMSSLSSPSSLSRLRSKDITRLLSNIMNMQTSISPSSSSSTLILSEHCFTDNINNNSRLSKHRNTYYSGGSHDSCCYNLPSNKLVRKPRNEGGDSVYREKYSTDIDGDDSDVKNNNTINSSGSYSTTVNFYKETSV